MCVYACARTRARACVYTSINARTHIHIYIPHTRTHARACAHIYVMFSLLNISNKCYYIPMWLVLYYLFYISLFSGRFNADTLFYQVICTFL